MNYRYRSIVLPALLGFIAASGAAFGDDGTGTQVRDDGQMLRTVSISPDSAYVNVSYGDIVRFESTDSKEFVWLFDGSADAVKLSAIAPDGIVVPPTRIYVNQDLSPRRASGR